MDRFDRIYELHKILSTSGAPVPMHRLCRKMECSEKTVDRTIWSMRHYLGAPIQYSHTGNGYYYDTRAEQRYELPGLWFSAAELYALLTMQRLLAEVPPGLLEESLAPLNERIQEILGRQRSDPEELTRRIRVLPIMHRPTEPQWFGLCAEATLGRQRLMLTYHGRERNAVSEREVSPQRLAYYRDNWYLDAWCHHSEGLRTFAVDRIRQAGLLERPAADVSDDELDAHFASAYGIFAGEPEDTAVLRFTPERARWVADEIWHPEQNGRYLDDGRYELRVPYADPRELLMDVLKHGAQVEVVAPRELREEIASILQTAASRYNTAN